MQGRRVAGLAMAAASGILYGSINVLAKPLPLHPLVKAAVAYLASALTLSPFLRGLRILPRDWPKVLAMGFVGAGVSPVLLFFGLRETAAADAGLLLTLEMVTTAALAFAFLRERFRPLESLGLLCLLAGAAFVALGSASGGAGGSTLRGALLVLGSAVGWGIDNTVSARLVGTYAPRSMIAIKQVLGGTACLAAALLVRAPAPGPVPGAAMAALGILSIGVSSLFFYTALQRVGAARTSAMNIATTALIGAVGGALLLGERLHLLHAAALAAVLLGAWLLARHHEAPAPSPAAPA